MTSCSDAELEASELVLAANDAAAPAAKILLARMARRVVGLVQDSGHNSSQRRSIQGGFDGGSHWSGVRECHSLGKRRKRCMDCSGKGVVVRACAKRVHENRVRDEAPDKLVPEFVVALTVHPGADMRRSCCGKPELALDVALGEEAASGSCDWLPPNPPVAERSWLEPAADAGSGAGIADSPAAAAAAGLRTAAVA